ncbi:hypothetical protein Tco_0959891 [Tanacetum coccineum]
MQVLLTLNNLQENGFQILLLFLAGYQDLFMVCRIGLFQAYDRKSKVAHQLFLEVYGNFYFVKGLGHNLFLVGQFCNLDLEEAFKRNACFIRNLATACYTQNRSLIHKRFNNTPYELINNRKLDISFLHVFGALCYPKNDRKDIRKLCAKGDIGSKQSDATRTASTAPVTLNLHTPNASITTAKTASTPTNSSIDSPAILNIS